VYQWEIFNSYGDRYGSPKTRNFVNIHPEGHWNEFVVEKGGGVEIF